MNKWILVHLKVNFLYMAAFQTPPSLLARFLTWGLQCFISIQRRQTLFQLHVLFAKITISILVCVYFHPVPCNRQKLTKYCRTVPRHRTWLARQVSWPLLSFVSFRQIESRPPFSFLLSQNHQLKLKWMLSNIKITPYVGMSLIWCLNWVNIVLIPFYGFHGNTRRSARRWRKCSKLK